jgi:hypothetical protein
MNDSPHFEPVFPSHAIERCGAAITFAWKCRVPALIFPLTACMLTAKQENAKRT